MAQNKLALLTASTMEIDASKFENPSECIRVWINGLMDHGFLSFAINYDVLDAESSYGSYVKEDDAFVVEDPYAKVSENEVVKYEREDGLDANAGLKGICSAFLQNGLELNGRWCHGHREGPGLICGPALEAKGIRAIWGRYKGGYLTGPGKVSLMDGDCTLEGCFVQGQLHGPVRGLTSRGRLAWAGLFKHGRSFGASWRGLEGGGFLYGSVGPKGLFSGHKNAFIYPDMKTALHGSFEDGKMVETVPVDVREVYMERSGTILRLKFTKPPYRAPIYQHWPSGLDYVSVPPLQEDPYEQKYVYAERSKMSDHAGDGLFAKRDVPANTTIAFYNGIRVRPEEPYPFENTGYQIYVDWNKPSEVTSDYMDIPPDYVSITRYRATLGHKINHSFDPNCRWGIINHPTFGRIPRVVTIKNIKAGTELSCHYMIDMAEAVADEVHCKWYVDLWEEFSSGGNKKELPTNSQQEKELMDTTTSDVVTVYSDCHLS